MWREIKGLGLMPYKHRAYFTSYSNARPFTEALRIRRNNLYIGQPTKHGYVVLWD